jgi:hypothetical protein
MLFDGLSGSAWPRLAGGGEEGICRPTWPVILFLAPSLFNMRPSDTAIFLSANEGHESYIRPEINPELKVARSDTTDKMAFRDSRVTTAVAHLGLEPKVCEALKHASWYTFCAVWCQLKMF